MIFLKGMQYHAWTETSCRVEAAASEEHLNLVSDV